MHTNIAHLSLHRPADWHRLPGRAEAPRCRRVRRNKPSAARSVRPETTQRSSVKNVQNFTEHLWLCHKGVFLPGLFCRQALYPTGCTLLVSQTVPCTQNDRPPRLTRNPPLLINVKKVLNNELRELTLAKLPGSCFVGLFWTRGNDSGKDGLYFRIGHSDPFKVKDYQLHHVTVRIILVTSH